MACPEPAAATVRSALHGYAQRCRAARQAGYSTNGAKVQGHRLLSRGDIQAALQYDGVELARAMARAATPDIITMLTNDACDDKARPVDSIRASLLLLELGGFLKRRGGRRA